MSIQFSFQKQSAPLTSISKMWGYADMPDSLDYPTIPYEDEGEEYHDPLTFLCQIRLEDIAPFDKANLLPHTGMLYFFADIDYFLGNLEAPSPGMGRWDADHFRVLYSPESTGLHTHKIVDEDGEPIGLPAEEITFSGCDERAYGFKMLGKPYFEEIEEQYGDWIALLQLDCDDDWRLQFYDCGMLCFMISPQDLAALRFDKAECYLHSS